MILQATYTEPPFCEKEILRYAGCRETTKELSQILQECIQEAKQVLSYKVCYCELSVSVTDDICDFEVFCTTSHTLARHLKTCKQAILFAATIGLGIDRLIAKYGRISPVKALLFQAIGAERIEALCDAFCDDIRQQYPIGIKTRFSPGYGDLPLEIQKNIFAILDCERKIGLVLNDSLFMSPSKSVTAIIGIGNNNEQTYHKCSTCNMQNCTFRGKL